MMWRAGFLLGAGILCFPTLAPAAEKHWQQKVQHGLALVTATFDDVDTPENGPALDAGVSGHDKPDAGLGALHMENGSALVVGVSGTRVTLLTARHVVKRGGTIKCRDVTVTFSQESRTVAASAVREENALDLAIVIVDVSEAQARELDYQLKIASQNEARRSKRVWLLGRRPDGLRMPISTVARQLRWGPTEIAFEIENNDRDPSHGGQSGGGLFDEAGNLIGILRTTGGKGEEAAAVRADLARTWLKQVFGDQRGNYNRTDGVGWVQIVGAPAGAELLVDDDPPAELREFNAIPTGEHVLRVRRSDYAPTPQWTMGISDGESKKCSVRLASGTSRWRGRTVPWLAGAEILAGIAGGAMLWAAQDDKSSFEQSWSVDHYSSFKRWNSRGSWTLTIDLAAIAGTVAWGLSGPWVKASESGECTNIGTRME